MEKFNKDSISSKEIKPEVTDFEKGIITSEKYSEEIKKDPTHFTAESILNFYQTEISRLYSITARINRYLEAKDKIPEIAAELSDLETTRPAQPLLIQQKIRDLQEYERKINMFEAGNIPEEILEEAKETIGGLLEKLHTYAKVKIIAEQNPSQN